MSKVVVGFCHRSDSISPQFRRSLTAVLVRDAATTRRVIGEIDQESSANIASGRCSIVRRFLDNPQKPDWLWMVDSDMTFADTILDRLLHTADAKTQPIVGGLCFGVRPVKVNGVEPFNAVGACPLELFPTIYTLDENGKMLHWSGYPADSVVQVHSTGAACLLVHRSVLEDPRWTADGHPQPWFRETVLNGGICSEDHFFCLKAGSLGYPIFLDTAAKTGHVKTFVADEDLFLAQRQVPTLEPTAVIVPVLNRPQNAAPFMESFRAATSDAATVYAVTEPSDKETVDAWRATGAEILTGLIAHTFAQKVNLGYQLTREPWLFLVGDDVWFHPGWLEQAQHTARQTGASVIGTNDLGNPRVMRGEASVHLLIRRAYIDEHGASWDGPKVVCHEGYHHCFVDNEILAAAKQRGVWAMALESRVEHLHPAWGKAESDPVYELGEAHADEDSELFNRRASIHA